ncbi:MAG: alpha-ketoglutarate-dependent dioxygenase AlkB [Leptolyngbya sp. Prado105]|jgi:alkylated DNA repair dioxygenase AlkB|nr:alpha-ketoglutarate-dependent dioxygenase AlkB [Leptolyngbya sp. Prado105]
MSHYEQINLWEDLAQPSNLETRPVSESLPLPNADIVFYPTLFTQEESQQFFSALQDGVNWKQEFIKIYGKSVPIPRLTAWYGDPGKKYIYSKIEMMPEPWNEVLLKIKSRIEPLAKVQFNSVLLNLYRDGKDSVSWHSDDEPELGQEPIIGSVSFGESRQFKLKHKSQEIKDEVKLTSGSFLLMQGTTQKFWLHQIPKVQKSIGSRINLTFRVIS